MIQPQTPGANRLRYSGPSSLVLAALLFASAGPARAQVPADPYNYSRSSSFEYNATTGLLTSETVEPDNIASCVKTTYTHDEYGNKITASSANCTGAVPVRQQFDPRGSGSDYKVVQTVLVQGANVTLPKGAFAISATNALGQSETREYDPRFGAVTKLIGPNGATLSTSWEVDDFGRKVKETRADGTSSVTFYCFLASAGVDTSSNSTGCPVPTAAEVPAGAVMFVHSEPRNGATKIGPFSRGYSDRAGREIRKVTEAFDGASQPAAPGTLIVQDTEFNTYGAAVLSTQPYFLAIGSSKTTGASDYGMSRSDYDVLGRPIAVYTTDAQGNQGSVAFGTRGSRQAAQTVIAYVALSTTTTNDKGQARVEERNINGQLVRVTDALGAQLAHQHDAFGNLIQTKDALQNALTIKYDIRGRKVEMTDPDTGLWQYDYNALGELVWQQSPNQRAANTTTTMAYDLLGRLKTRTEPEYTSTWTYDKYADNSACDKGIGKLCESSTSNGVSRKLVYDSLGRPLSTRTTVSNGPSFASAVSYDAIGRLASQVYPTGVQVVYNYTSKGFLDRLTLGTTATVNPLPATVGGTPAASTTLSAGSVLWQAQVFNAWGKAEQQTLGNGVISKASFDAMTGRTQGASAGVGAATNVLNHSYVWDSINNLISRADANGDGNTGAVSEVFTYDSINRLQDYTVSAPLIPGLTRKVTLQYNALGSLLYKSDVGVYTYNASGANAPRPHALASVAGTVNSSYVYDANGNLTSATGGKYSSVAYTSFNLPDSQTGLRGPGGTPQYTWQYDENHQRIKETRLISGSSGAAGTRTTWMLHPDNAGGLGFESEVNSPSSASASNPAGTSNRHYLSAGGASIGVLVSTGALPVLAPAQTSPVVLGSVTLVKVEYWHKDHLGSLVATTDHAGSVTARYAYDPFGKRRYTTGSYDAFGSLVVDWSPAVNSGNDRGYTGHEHLDDVGLIHMNGRIYDPNLGVFLQGDPFIQTPDNLQNYNRYAYCYNTPVTCTDPTGYFSWKGLFKANFLYAINPTLKNTFNFIAAQPGQAYVDQFVMTHSWAYAIGQIVVSYWGGPAGAAAYASYYSYRATGSMTAAVRAGVVSYASAMAFQFAGDLKEFYGWQSGSLGGIAVHAVTGCVTSVIGGGKCGSGALSAAFAEAMTPTTAAATKGNDLAGTMVSAVVGGTGSVLGGGKFANGAITGAFGYIFNKMQHEERARIVATGIGLGGIAGAGLAGVCTAGTAGFCGVGFWGITALGAASGGVLANAYADSVDWLEDQSISMATAGGTTNTSAAVHGNSLASIRPTYVYMLVDSVTGDVLKFGITSNPVAEARYTLSYYAQNNAKMEVLALYPFRSQARAHEVALCSTFLAFTAGNLPKLSKVC